MQAQHEHVKPYIGGVERARGRAARRSTARWKVLSSTLTQRARLRLRGVKAAPFRLAAVVAPGTIARLLSAEG